MLETLLGNKSMEKILLFLLMHGRCYATQIHQLFEAPLTPIQQAFVKLERAGIVMSQLEGKTRYFQFNPSYALLNELEALLKKAYSLLPAHKQKKYCETLPRHCTRSITGSHVNQQRSFVVKDTLKNVWKRLLNIHHLSFSAKSKSLVKSGWNGTGKGCVEVKSEDEGSCIFSERGTWSSAEGQEFDFSNVFRWSIDQALGAVTLEHLRFGPQHPVFLFNLVPVADNILESVSPYICNEDTYVGQLRCDDHYIQLLWKTLGPKKNEEIDYLYT